ncbi:acyl carrier protein [Candidatus Binatus sp.]|uniref:acyl carrier protein n=1 Tax=Candidatus Binatus sp. TaxID=2811406 RepID=UPI002F922DB2
MTNEAILERVRYIVAEITEVEVERITLQSSPTNLEEWDSLAQVNIVLSLEQDFGCQFSPDQIERMVSVEKIVEVLTARAQ